MDVHCVFCKIWTSF